jgi:hypothetical protein
VTALHISRKEIFMPNSELGRRIYAFLLNMPARVMVSHKFKASLAKDLWSLSKESPRDADWIAEQYRLAYGIHVLRRAS